MQKSGYERYGLRSNPFRDLSSESLESVDIFHIEQPFDDELDRMKEEVMYKENKAVVAILGGLGAGKTERLLLAASEAKQNDVFFVLRNMTFETKWIVEGILELILKHNTLGFFERVFTAPKWYKAVVKKKKHAQKAYDPEEAGRVIAHALNENAPAFLLMNDFHHLQHAADAERFLHVLHVLFDHIDPGVMVMISSDTEYFTNLMQRHHSLNERINRQLMVPPLSDEEAQLMIAKRLLEKRLVDDVDPLYPFSPDAIGVLNDEAEGNPRHLLKLADVVIDHAAKRRIITIDEGVVLEVISSTKNKTLNIEYEEKPPVISNPILPVVEVDQQPQKQRRGLSGRLRRSEQSSVPLSSSQSNPGPNAPRQHDENQDSIEQPVPTVVRKDNPVESPDSSGRQAAGEKNSEDHEVRRPSPPKPKKQKQPIEPVKPEPESEKPVAAVEEDESDEEEIITPKPVQKKPQKEECMVKIRCPECSKVFAMELEGEEDTIRCPYCEFIGSIS